MDLLIVGSVLGITLGLVMILAFIVPALRERQREENETEVPEQELGPFDDQDDESGARAAELRNLSLNREEIWNRGCRGETMDEGETREFHYLARARFHTFRMGISHAESTRDDEKASMLVQGLAVELANSPGLERAWYESPVSEDPQGKAVNERLVEIHKSGQA